MHWAKTKLIGVLQLRCINAALRKTYQVNVISLQFLQAGSQRDVQAFRGVAPHIPVLHVVFVAKVRFVGERVLGCDDHLVSDVPLLEPFADPSL